MNAIAEKISKAEILDLKAKIINVLKKPCSDSMPFDLLTYELPLYLKKFYRPDIVALRKDMEITDVIESTDITENEDSIQLLGHTVPTLVAWNRYDYLLPKLEKKFNVDFSKAAPNGLTPAMACELRPARVDKKIMEEYPPQETAQGPVIPHPVP
ncbi:MAG TPA: hypothetical protein PKX38_07275 [Alphaproteobacteria bacterium]|jgi:hypothetical protein|nr:hypothetical protein [Micavibrio sp.]HQX27722.1 hypothetical protein [Alphaproteobacteria bacterium]